MAHKYHSSYVCISRLRSALGAGLVSLVFIMPTVVIADVIIAEHDWDTTGIGSWDSQDGNSTVTDNTGYLQISFPLGAPGLGESYDTVSTPKDDLFAGTWTTDYWIEFDFWAQDVVPDTLQIHWGAESGNTWVNAIDTSGVGIDSWASLRTDTFDYENWSSGPYEIEESEFLTDLNDINWIGIYIERGGSGAELYGVDDFKLMVPEPAEYLLLFAALGTAVIAMRRKKNSLAIVEV